MPVLAALPAIGSSIMAAAPAIGSLVGAGSGIAGLLGGGSQTNGTYGGPSGTYMPQNLGQSDSQYTNLIGSMINPAQALPGQISSGSQPYVQNIMNNPYSGQSQGWASQLAGLGQGISGQDLGGMSSLVGAGSNAMGYAPGILNSAMGYGNQIMNTAFDPQNSLHDLSAMQNSDSTNAVNSMNGVAGTPFGAGLASQSNRDFENQWQNNQLARQATGANAYNGLLSNGVNGYGSLMGLGSNLMGQGASLGNNAINSLYSTGNMPYSTYMGQQNDALGGLGSFNSLTSGSMAPGQDILSALGNYLGFGNNASRTAMSGQGQGFSQGQTTGSNVGQTIGSGLSGLGSLFGGSQSFAQPYSQATSYPSFSSTASMYPGGSGLSTSLPYLNF